MVSHPPREVRQERSGWRDESLSRRHRDWGYDCPGVDLDFPLVEFNAGKPAALIEYKAVGAMIPNLNSPTYQALQTLANNSHIPFMVVFYEAMHWVFKATPANVHCAKFIKRTTTFSEREYVSLLYAMRGLSLPFGLSMRLSSYKPGSQP